MAGKNGKTRKNNTKSDEAEITERARKVWDMYCSRMTQQMIADALGIVVSTVNKDLKKVKAAYHAEMIETGDKMIKRELAMLDRLERKAQIQLQATNSMKWMDRIIKISERRAKLLGLDTHNVKLETDQPVMIGWASDEDMKKARANHKGDNNANGTHGTTD